MACSIYGNPRVPSDVDIVCLTDKHTQAELKAILVNKNSNFYTVASKDPTATYRVLWYRLSGLSGLRYKTCKVDVLTPGIMNIPAVPPSRIAYRASRSDLPLMPFLPLLLLKLQAWMDHRTAAKNYLVVKQFTDVGDIDELLELAVAEFNVDLKADRRWLPESFVKAAVTRVKSYVRNYPDSVKHWREIGFNV